MSFKASNVLNEGKKRFNDINLSIGVVKPIVQSIKEKNMSVMWN